MAGEGLEETFDGNSGYFDSAEENTAISSDALAAAKHSFVTKLDAVRSEVRAARKRATDTYRANDPADKLTALGLTDRIYRWNDSQSAYTAAEIKAKVSEAMDSSKVTSDRKLKAVFKRSVQMGFAKTLVTTPLLASLTQPPHALSSKPAIRAETRAEESPEYIRKSHRHAKKRERIRQTMSRTSPPDENEDSPAHYAARLKDENDNDKTLVVQIGR